EPFRYRYKHSINTPEGTVSIVVIDAPWGGSGSSSMRSDRTFHRDHLGSTVAITDENGTEFLGYDAWGKRRNANGQDNNIAAWVGLSSKTDRGYTGHEHIDDIGLIHMNGRLYDPITGRMMSADPIIQAPYLLQNYNRYSYVMNNPLSLTDPSGFSWWTRHRRTILAIGVSLLIGGFDFSNFFANGSFRWELGFNGVGGAIAGGFASGGIMGGNIESAVNGAFSAALFYGVGELSGAHEAAAAGRSMTGAEHLAQTAGHAVVGCFSTSIAGGSCGSGAASAGFAAAAGPLLPGADISPERFFARVIVGGTASRLAGDNFANGATSAAFAYLFNDLGKPRPELVRVPANARLTFAEDVALRKLEQILMTSVDVFTDRAHQVCPECSQPLSTWKVAVDMSIVHHHAVHSGNTSRFGPVFFKADALERLDTVAHEFRHHMPENRGMSFTSGWVQESPGERDARTWASDFWKRKVPK
ncbi:MAG: RHS repeat domain-containing protein, partial [Betaproteobacteria bacterium]